jgi:hypothetical protein
MTDLYVRTTGGNSNAAATYSLTSGGGATGSVPTAADRVLLDASSGQFTINAAFVARSIDATGYTGTLTHNAAITATIGDATAGTGNIALKLVAGMTYTLGNAATSAWSFNSTSATQQTITTAGKTLGNVTYGGGASPPNYLFSGSYTSTGSMTHTRGTLDTGNQTVQATSLLSNNSNVRTLTLGSSAITLTLAGEAVTATTVTNLTITANTATITLTGANASTRTNFTSWNGTTLVYTGGGTMRLNTGGTAAIYGALTVTGTAVQSDTFNMGATTVNPTITGLLNLSGPSAVNRLTVLTNASGAPITVTAGSTSISNVDFMDITAAGAASWAITSGVVGDMGGNTGITVTTPTTQTRDSTNGQAWSVAARWTSRVPLPQDTVVLNASSGSISATDVSKLGGTQDYTNYLGTITQTSSSATYSSYGSVTLGTGMSFGTTPNTFNYDFGGRGNYTITCNGKTFFPATSNQALQVNAPNGTYTLGDAFFQSFSNGTAVSFRVAAGAFVTNNYDMTIGRFLLSGTLTKSITLGTSTLNLMAISNIVMISLVTGGTTWSGSSATFVIASPYTNSSARTIDLQNFTIGTLTYTVANSISTLSFISSGTIITLNVNGGKQISQNANVVLSVVNWNVNGQVNGYISTVGDGVVASVPDSTQLSIAGDIDIRFYYATDDWAQAGTVRLIAKYLSAGNQIAWRVTINGKVLSFTFSSTGSDNITAASTTPYTLVNNTGYWFRVTRQQSTGRTQFFTSNDPPSTTSPTWTQVGTNVTVSAGTAIFDSTALVTFGAEQGALGTQFRGYIYRGQIRDNVLDNGTGIQLDADFTTKTVGVDTFTEGSTNAATVTMAGSGILGDGRVSLISNTAGTQGVLSTLLGVWQSQYLVVKDQRMQDPYMFFITNSVDAGNNLNVNFTAKPSAPLIRQSAYLAGSSNSHTGTFLYPTTAGNLLLYVATIQLNPGTYNAPVGYTLAKDNASTTDVYVKMYYKIADGTETTISATWVTPRSNDVTVYEVSGWVGVPTLDVTDSNFSLAGQTSLSTGSGVTNTAAPAFAIAEVGGGGTMGATVLASPPTNGFQEAYGTAGGRNRIAAKPLTSTASQSTTMTWTTSRIPASILAVFIDVGVVSSTPVSTFLLMGI